MGSNHTGKFSKGTLHPVKIRERMGPSRGVIQKCEPHERNPCAPRIEERTRDETLQQERCARGVAWDLAKSICKLKHTEKASFYSPIEAKAMSAPTSKNSRGIRGRFWASVRTTSKSESSSEEMGTVKRSKKPYGSVDCSWRSAHRRGGTSVRS